LYRAVERNSDPVWQKILARSSRCPRLNKPRGAFKLELALLRFYLIKPSKRRGAAMEPIGIRGIPVMSRYRYSHLLA